MKPFDPTFKDRPLSWSQISSFSYDPNQWARKYLDGINDPPNPAMEFGRIVGEAIASKHPHAPQVPRGDVFEYEMRATINKVPLIGFLDSFNASIPAMFEYKTSAKSDKWTQKSVDDSGQITMYALLLFLQDKIHPKDLSITLSAIHVRTRGDFIMEIHPDTPIQSFKTTRTMKDIMRFAAYIEKTIKEMEKFSTERLANKK